MSYFGMANRQQGSDRGTDYSALQSALVGAVSSVFSRFGQSNDSAQPSHSERRDLHPARRSGGDEDVDDFVTPLPRR